MEADVQLELPPKVEEATASIRVRSGTQRFGRYLRLLVTAAQSRRGVWVVIGVLLAVLLVATVGFRYWGWPLQFIPLYAADAEMLVVASAIYVIAVTWDHNRKPK